ncbi:DNA-binding protein LIV4 [Malania oleifera]|uniref:DNA-binding protein LIV4 n=1 Tax=Malania oleifera TaxID=397392 RepID=UPI0025AE0829|nr:DNA-binding protein LIV4 [Malania oleifera]XP_057954814.1 DNA-binding protein LIV4 [Malania oleifera]
MGAGLEGKDVVVGELEKKSRKAEKNKVGVLEVMSNCHGEKKKRRKKKIERARMDDSNEKEMRHRKKRKLDLTKDETENEKSKKDKRSKVDKDCYYGDGGDLKVNESLNEKVCALGDENERLQTSFKKDMEDNHAMEARKVKKNKHKESRCRYGFDRVSTSKEFTRSNEVGDDKGLKITKRKGIAELNNLEEECMKKHKKKKHKEGKRDKEFINVSKGKSIAKERESRKAKDHRTNDLGIELEGNMAKKLGNGITRTEDEDFDSNDVNAHSFRNKTGEGAGVVFPIAKEDGCKNKAKKVKSVQNGFAGVLSAEISDETTEHRENSKSKRKDKRVSFSGNVEVFPLSDDQEEGLLQGKRFSKEEDEIVKKAVLKYVEEHDLGEEGINMVMHCRSHPKLRSCWKEIAASLPWRPWVSIYYRAHILFERDESRVWTDEEIEMIKKHHEQHGSNWKMLAEALGKHRFHVKDQWRRIKLPNVKKGHWSQEEYQLLFDYVNMDLRMKAFELKKSKHGMLRDNICWGAISDKLGTRSNATCCTKWYGQLSSPMVAEGKWTDADDYHLLNALVMLDACCVEDVDWDSILEHRPGDVCRKRWSQMVNHLGEHRNKSFAEQVEVLSNRYCPELLEVREAYDSRPTIP